MGLEPTPHLGSPKFSTTGSTSRTALHVARNTKTSQSIRDQVVFHLITPKNSALILIDYQLPQVAAVCHGPAGFLSAHRADGTWLFRGRQLTGFSNGEETQASFAGNAPWLLEDRLRLAGANYIAKATWTPHAVVDGNRITGQQSTSAGVTADAVLWKLKVIA